MKNRRQAEAEKVIYEYQKRRLEEMYSDVGGLDDIRSFFFELAYPPPEERERFAERNLAFSRMVRNPLIRLICSREVIRTLENTRELNELTERLDGRVAKELSFMDPMPEHVDEKLYFEISSKVSTYEERMRQLEYAMGGFMLGIGVVIHLPLNLEQIIRIVPKRLVGNKDLFELAVEIYRVFYNHRDDLEGYLELMNKRESDYLKRMFGRDADG